MASTALTPADLVPARSPGSIAGEAYRDFGEAAAIKAPSSCYIAGATGSFAWDIGLGSRTTPIESPRSNGMAEAFCPHHRATTCASVHFPTERPSCGSCFVDHPYNEVHPHKLPHIVRPRVHRRAPESPDRSRSFRGLTPIELFSPIGLRFLVGCPMPKRRTRSCGLRRSNASSAKMVCATWRQGAASYRLRRSSATFGRLASRK